MTSHSGECTNSNVEQIFRVNGTIVCLASGEALPPVPRSETGFGKVLVDEKERKEKNGARSGPPKIEARAGG